MPRHVDARNRPGGKVEEAERTRSGYGAVKLAGLVARFDPATRKFESFEMTPLFIMTSE